MSQFAFWLLLIDWILRLGFSLHVIIRPRPLNISLAWLMLILLFPVIGTFIYLLLGENRLDRKRAAWVKSLRHQYQYWKSRQAAFNFREWTDEHSDSAQLSRMIFLASDALPLSGNRVQLLTTADEVFARMIADIDAAVESCLLEYYIWEVGGQADQLMERLAMAARRGVRCQVLVDAIGSSGFLQSQQRQNLAAAGVEIQSALPTGILRSLLYRFDLRLHRKLVVIDGRLGYTGSQNMADPKLFKSGLGIGQWVDAMVRLEGPAVDALLMVFAEDWQFESTKVICPSTPEQQAPPPQARGTSIVQVVPSGPGIDSEGITQILLNAIYSADRQLTLTTPYLVPDESLLRALISAARRGVDVTVIIPKRVDSRLVRLASRPALRELTETGVRIARYGPGMLHTKSITIDGECSFFGSLNLDPRSIHLNFEIMLAIYDEAFTGDLLKLQQEYLNHSELLLPGELSPGNLASQFAESAARLLSPLL
ncbi:MAG: cardiolipin synthase [Planctomycetota bacterium]|jgi:cardiolipin synthase|nr:cardiolipin synthase [Blastopirellula sp.]